MSLIEAKNLSYVYDNGTSLKVYALKNINLSIEKDQIIGVIGHTGSGKSTLMKLLNGLIKPSEGKILINSKDIWSDFEDVRQVHFKVGLTFQYPEQQIFKDTVYEDIAFGPTNQGLSEEEIKDRVKKAAEFVKISENLLDKSPFDLSGGEKRRVAIAGIIAMDPEVLILDEPTAGLDPSGKQEILNAIYNYQKYKKNTVIFISHIMEDIAKMSDKIIVLNKGNLVMFDRPEKVFSNYEELSKIHLDIPQISRIMGKIYEKINMEKKCVIRVEDAVREITGIFDKKRVNWQ